MLDVRVCSSCLSRRSDGLSRVSEKIWTACFSYLQEQHPEAIINQDDFIEVYADSGKQNLLMTNEDGFNVEDSFLQEVIRADFVSYRAETKKLK